MPNLQFKNWKLQIWYRESWNLGESRLFLSSTRKSLHSLQVSSRNILQSNCEHVQERVKEVYFHFNLNEPNRFIFETV